MFIKIALLLLFSAVTVFVGFYFRKRASDVHGFVLAGRNVGPWLTAFAYGTTYFSAVVFVGYAGQFGWKFGTAAVWIGLGNAFIGSLLPWIILGRRTRIMTHHLNSATMPEFFGSRFNSNLIKVGASIIIFIFLIPYTASLYNGLSRLFAMAFGIDFTVCIVVMAVLTGIYVILGGYFATAVNDLIQGIIMLVGIVAVIATVLNDNGGFAQALNSLAHVQDAAVSSSPGIFTSFFGPDPVSLLGVVLLTSLGTWGLPQIIQRFYSIKSEHAISTGATISTIFAVVIAGGCYFIGSFGRLYADRIDLKADGFDSIIPTMLSDFPAFLIGIVVILVLSASMSTLSALVMTSASTFTLDFLKGNIFKKMSGEAQLFSIRALIVVFILISSIIAIVQYKGGITFIAQMMGISWGALAGSFLAPFLYGLYWKRVSPAAVWCCFLFSTSLMVLNVFFRGSFPPILQSPINAGAFVMLAGLVIVPVVSLFTKAPGKATIDSCFSCYEETVSVKASEDLGDDADAIK
ncbi:MAG: sodium:solute symporter [Zoogloeaceae bacterium]|jgi:SSS family solute:Na+ symporter/sodium/proline symporter|nr:sodium:solute symporter [Zoogloeaceae bacterium]